MLHVNIPTRLNNKIMVRIQDFCNGEEGSEILLTQLSRIGEENLSHKSRSRGGGGGWPPAP